jgi:serine protease Do
LRDGKNKSVDLKVGLRPEDEEASAGSEDLPAPGETDRIGLSVQPLSPQHATRLGIEGGVQIAKLRPEGSAARAGARVGDAIVELQRQPIHSIHDYQAALADLKPGDMALLRLQRENASIYLAVHVAR